MTPTVARFSLLLHDGQLIVLEQHDTRPLVAHVFDSPEDALSFYERSTGRRLPEAKRAALLRLQKAATN